MDDPYKYFRIEARELADELEKGVLDLDRGAPASAVVASLLRFAHTLKGAARVVKQPDIADQAHALEDALGPFRESAEPVPRDRLGVALGLLDGIRSRVAALASPGEKDSDKDSDEGAAPAQRAAPEDALRTVRADVAEMDALLGGVSAAHAHLGSLRGGVGLVDKARDLVEVLVHELAPLRRRDFTPSEPGASREAARSIERAHSIAGELRGVVGALEQNLGNSVEQVDRELRQARDAAQRMRLVPAASMFTDLERAARDVAQMQGKRVLFAGRGGNLRLDAHVVAVAQSALHQIVRNAVAHGIESENERQAAGKPPDGRVTLEVARRDRRVVFNCSDDGRGVDLDAVRGVVHRRGLASAGTRHLGPEELIDLLLKGGISTSRTVTEVSGRGIGLDVVRDAAARLGGQITVTTTSGHGTTVELVAPLSLAALEALTVEAGDGAMTLPLDAVRRTLRVRTDEIASSSRGESLVHEGRSIPFLPLAAALWDTAAPTRSRRSWSTVIVEGQGDVAAIGVHRLLGTANIAVRPLPDTVPASAAVSGVWTDADGNPRLVLDPDGLVAEARRHRQPASDEEAPDPPILVIDDSLTTRMLEQSILESAGYDVEVASSAEEALAMAATTRYSLFLVDVEMPGMDGFTFIERTRASTRHRDLPCILVTSRASPEDRRRGFDAGAQAYIAKGRFDQRELLARVRELMAG